MTELGQPRCYDDLLAVLRVQIDRLGLGINQLDEVCGLAHGHAAKIFGPSQTRKIGQQTLWLLLPELGLRMMLVEDETLLAARRIPSAIYEKHQARLNYARQPPGIHVISRVLRHIGQRGGRKRMSQLSKQELREHQVNAAKARWVRKRRKS